MYRKKVLDGYYERIVTYDERLSLCPYGSCGIIKHNDGTITLVSYTTCILDLTSDGWLVPRFNPAYSRTTIKHVGYFMKEFTKLNYYTAKDIYNKDICLNINTGETMPYNDFAKQYNAI